MKRYAVAEYVFICDNFLPVSACEGRPAEYKGGTALAFRRAA